MSQQPFAGVIFGSEDGLIHLPLEEVEVRALIVDLSARVDVIQTFYNPARNSTPRAKYVFPLPARAVVCAFDMGTSSGQVIIGVAKDNEQAKADFEQAIKHGRKTALVEWAADDIFTISLGSIAGRERMTTTISYALDLMDGDIATQVRLQIPMRVGERYGVLPAGMVGAAPPSSATRVRVTAHIQMRGIIESVTSPSHPTMSVAAYETHLGRPSRHRTVAKFRSSDFLRSDFVLVVKAAGLDLPRCFAERDPRGSGSLAMQLTLMPKFDLPPIGSQEFIFLVDRSGSMAKDRIQTAKKTLSMLLRFLPGRGAATMFNIFSFGNHCDALWNSSSPYSNVTLAQAASHVSKMDANYGGTEIKSAIMYVLAHRDNSRPTSIFVLTDGESYDHDATVRVVATAVASSPSVAPLRVFTLGIGSTASSAMCEAIARAGNGICLMAVETEDLVAKCAKLLRAGRSILLKNISVDWGVPPDALRQPQAITAHAVLRQAPTSIGALYPGVRFIVFALIDNAKFATPKTITLHAQRDGAGEILKFPIPVEDVRFSDQNELRLIHTLAAKRLITDLEDDAWAKRAMSDDERKTAVIALGETYQLASRHTSFVAVEDDGKIELPIPRPAWAKSVLQRRQTNKPSVRQTSAENSGVVHALAGYADAAVTYGGLFVSEFLGGWFGSPTRIDQAQGTPPGQRRDASQPRDPGDEEDEPAEEDYDSDRTFSTLSSLISSASDWSDTESRPSTPEPVTRSPSPELHAAPVHRPTSPAHLQFGALGTAGPVDDQVEKLIGLQSYDGSFTLDDQFRRLIGSEAVDKAPPQTDPQLWATALAVAFCRKHMIGQQDLLDCLVEKVLEYVAGSGRAATNFDALIEEAMRAL